LLQFFDFLIEFLALLLKELKLFFESLAPGRFHQVYPLLQIINLLLQGVYYLLLHV